MDGEGKLCCLFCLVASGMALVMAVGLCLEESERRGVRVLRWHQLCLGTVPSGPLPTIMAYPAKMRMVNFVFVTLAITVYSDITKKCRRSISSLRTSEAEKRTSRGMREAAMPGARGMPECAADPRGTIHLTPPGKDASGGPLLCDGGEGEWGCHVLGEGLGGEAAGGASEGKVAGRGKERGNGGGGGYG